jgi:spermidine/putrescine transport system permease protein
VDRGLGEVQARLIPAIGVQLGVGSCQGAVPALSHEHYYLKVKTIAVRAPGNRRPHAALRLLGPASGFYVLFFLVPLVILGFLSFWSFRGFEVIPDWTISNYVDAVASDLYLAVFARTILIGLGTAAIVVPMAYLLAYLMRFVFDSRGQLLLDLVLVSMFSGYLVRIYAWRTILGKEGLLNTALMQIGVISQPITILIYSSWAVVITLVGLLLPLALLPVYSSMSNISLDHLEVARDLGSKGLGLHRTVIIPMVLPGIGAAFAIAFILTIGDFVVPTMVGGTQGIMVGNLIADQFNGSGANWPQGAAFAFLLLASVIVVYLATTKVIRWVTRW